MRIRLMVLLLVCGVARGVFGWGFPGHRIIARVAEDDLSPEARAGIRALIGNRPLESVATLPDQWVDDRPQTQRWHFVNVPLDGTFSDVRDCPDDDCVIAQLQRWTTFLADTSNSQRRRIDALAYVVHFAGDLHQPLHNTTLVRQDGSTDRGGTRTFVFLENGERVHLHRVWDSVILAHARTEQQWVTHLTNRLRSIDARPLQEGSILGWSQDAHALARAHAYTIDDGDTVTTDYLNANAPVVEEQLLRASARLRRLLNFAFRQAVVGPTGAPQTVVVAGWNILGVDPIPDDRIANIAETIERIDPHVIVLTEVNPNDAPARIVEHLGAGYQPPVILEQNAEVVQNIALIFKDGVTVTDAELLEGTDLAEEPRSRKALKANVRIGNFDFILIGVHLKSSRDGASRAMRTRQCTAIAEFIDDAVSGDEKDVLVVGDYNMIPRRGRTRNDEVNFFALSPDNFLRFVSTDFLNGRTSHIDGCPLRGNLLDGFAISREFTREYVGDSTRLLTFNQLGRDCDAFLDEVSDHLPVVSRFRVDRPDDD